MANIMNTSLDPPSIFRRQLWHHLDLESYASLVPALQLASRFLHDRTPRMKRWWSTVMIAHSFVGEGGLPQEVEVQVPTIDEEVFLRQTWIGVGREPGRLS